jgi:hypothetical protein
MDEGNWIIIPGELLRCPLHPRIECVVRWDWIIINLHAALAHEVFKLFASLTNLRLHGFMIDGGIRRQPPGALELSYGIGSFIGLALSLCFFLPFVRSMACSSESRIIRRARAFSSLIACRLPFS